MNIVFELNNGKLITVDCDEVFESFDLVSMEGVCFLKKDGKVVGKLHNVSAFYPQ